MASPVQQFQYEDGAKIGLVNPEGPNTAKVRAKDLNDVAIELTARRQAAADLAAIVAAGPAADSITEAKLAPAVRAKLNAVGSGGGTTPAYISEHAVVVAYNIGTGAQPSWGAVFAVPSAPGLAVNGSYLKCPAGNPGYYEFKMSGTGFSLWHHLNGGEHTKYDVWVDGGVIDTVDLTAPSDTPARKIYESPALTDGPHTVRIISVPSYGAVMILNQIRVEGAFTSQYMNG